MFDAQEACGLLERGYVCFLFEYISCPAMNLLCCRAEVAQVLKAHGNIESFVTAIGICSNRESRYSV